MAITKACTGSIGETTRRGGSKTHSTRLPSTSNDLSVLLLRGKVSHPRMSLVPLSLTNLLLINLKLTNTVLESLGY